MTPVHPPISASDLDRSSIEAFYVQNRPRCLHIACKVTGGNRAMAEDALHNAFLGIIKDWESFASLPGEDQLTRCEIIVKNKAIDLLREARRKAYSKLNDDLYYDPDKSTEVSIIVENKDNYETLLRCIAKLPKMYKTVFELRLLRALATKKLLACCA